MATKPAYIAFATNLRNAMNRKAFTQSDLVSRANVYAPKTHQLSRSNLSEYCNGKRLPGPVRLEAITRALEVSISDLLPSTTPRTRNALARETPVDMMELFDLGDGRVRMVFDRKIPWPKAMEIQGILGLDKSKGSK